MNPLLHKRNRPSISFSTNWNNKLDNKIFSTFRKATKFKEDEYAGNLGEEHEIKLRGKWYCYADLVGIRKTKLSEVPDFLLWLDTGYDKQSTALQIFESLGIKKEDEVLWLFFKRK